MRIALALTGGVDRSGRVRVIPALLAFVERMARRHTLVVYALRYHDEPCSYPLLGAAVHDLGRPRGLGRQYAALVNALRRDAPFDLIHAYWALPAGLAAALAGRRLGIPSLVTLDSGELVGLPDIDYGLQLRLRQRLAVTATLRLATQLSVCSGYMMRLAERHGAAPVQVPIGIDTTFYTPGPRPEGPPWRLLHVASLNRVKDQPTLLSALRLLAASLPVHLDIAGEDTLGGAMQRLAARIGVDRHVTFHGGLPSDALVALYRAAHVLIVSSRHEAAGVAVLEAAACGVPTVGSAVGYVADWAPEAAVAVPPGDPAALAGATAALLADPARRGRLAAAARSRTLGHDADATAEAFDLLYHQLATRR
jgi:glycosyltransferase involved in cell wall biosynthesis